MHKNMKFTQYFRKCHDLSNKPPVSMVLSPFVTSTVPRVVSVSTKSLFLFASLPTEFFSSYELREDRKLTIVLALCVNRMRANSHTLCHLEV